MSIIHDRHGRKYTVSESGSQDYYQRFNIEHRRNRVGYANCHFEGDDVLHLDDLHIEDKAMYPPWFFVDLIFWIGSLPPERWRVTNYRERGIGTAMIKFLASYARSKSAKRIEGEVKHHDFKDNPQLPEWYRRRGFAVVMGDGKSGYIAKISLAL
jgi:GNAT superfamily N-acetyltransferase